MVFSRAVLTSPKPAAFQSVPLPQRSGCLTYLPEAADVAFNVSRNAFVCEVDLGQQRPEGWMAVAGLYRNVVEVSISDFLN